MSLDEALDGISDRSRVGALPQDLWELASKEFVVVAHQTDLFLHNGTCRP